MGALSSAGPLEHRARCGTPTPTLPRKREREKKSAAFRESIQCRHPSSAPPDPTNMTRLRRSG